MKLPVHSGRIARIVMVVSAVAWAAIAVITPSAAPAPSTSSKPPGAPSKPGAALRSSTVTFTVQGRPRRAVVVNASASGARRPAVIVLHGGAGSADRMREASGFDAIARAHGAIVVYAEGTDYGAGRHAWNTGYLLRRQVEGADDIAYFDTLIDTIVRNHRADPRRITMTGGSNGGMMTYVYAVTRPTRLAAAAPVVASMFSFDTVPGAPVPILIINGALDDEVPLEGGMSRNPLVSGAQSAPYKPVADVVAFWVKANRSVPDGVVSTNGTVTTTTYSAGPGGAVTEFVVDSAGGHGWPGTADPRAGNQPITSFDGATRVWQFLADKVR
jgi:polyhydroxybutyrate depolymerase